MVASLGSAPDAARAVEGDVVYHVAAATSGMPADFFLNTVVASEPRGGVRLACPSARIVLVSSFSVYGTAALRRGDRLDETAPLEPHPERRDVYSHAKLRQERLFWDYRDRHGLNLTVSPSEDVTAPAARLLRPHGNAVTRPLPALRGRQPPAPELRRELRRGPDSGRAEQARGRGSLQRARRRSSFCRQYFRAYTRRVRRMRWVPVPYPALLALSWLLEKYHLRTKGKIGARARLNPTAWPPIGSASRSTTRSSRDWDGPRVSTEEGMSRTFEWLRQQEPRIAS